MMTENNISTRDAYGYALADLGSEIGRAHV